MTIALKYESLKVPIDTSVTLHMMRFYRDKRQLGAPVFMLHSNLQDGSSFYSPDGHGLACYLAKQGYDVYVADARGKGRSLPSINTYADSNNHQLITQDIPAFVQKIVAKRGDTPQIWVGHGWGGVMLASYYARYGNELCDIERMVHMGVRKFCTDDSLKKWLIIDVLWGKLARVLIAIVGYFPAKILRLGKSNESAGNRADFLLWSQRREWVDPTDAFDYGEAIQQRSVPPSYYFSSMQDRVYGHPDDVRHFMQSLGPHDGRMMVLSRDSGNLRNYNHLDMILHKESDQDHFPLLLDWLESV